MQSHQLKKRQTSNCGTDILLSIPKTLATRIYNVFCASVLFREWDINNKKLINIPVNKKFFKASKITFYPKKSRIGVIFTTSREGNAIIY